MCCSGGKKSKGRSSGGGGGGNRGVRGVDFGLGIGYSHESYNASSHSVPCRSVAVNSLKTGIMAQFKSSFVAASSDLHNSSGTLVNKRPALAGFVSGGTIGTQTTNSVSSACTSTINTIPNYGENVNKNPDRLNTRGISFSSFLVCF